MRLCRFDAGIGPRQTAMRANRWCTSPAMMTGC